MKAYFSYINSRKGPDGRRGVYGRQIVFKYYDDGYNPANSVQLTRRLDRPQRNAQESRSQRTFTFVVVETDAGIRDWQTSSRFRHPAGDDGRADGNGPSTGRHFHYLPAPCGALDRRIRSAPCCARPGLAVRAEL